MDRKKLVKDLGWSLAGELAGIICALLAWFVPGDASDPLKSGLFVFGAALAAGYAAYSFANVYKPLKKEEGE